MPLSDALDALFTSRQIDAISLGGTFNIETATAEVKSDYFGSCDCSSLPTLTANCRECGRRDGNNVSFLSGRGDGVYSGICMSSDGGTSLLAAAYVFDEDNEFAARVAETIGTGSKNWQRLLIDACEPYLDLPGSEIGQLTTNQQVGLLIGDRSAGQNSEDAVVDHWFSGGSSFKVFIFVEPILDSAMAATAIALGGNASDYTGGYSESIRPRVALIVRTEFADRHMRSDRALRHHDWKRQAAAWNSGLVASNMAGGNNILSMYWNGVYWRSAQQQQLELVGEPDDVWYMYGLTAFGWFVQGAMLGDDDCLNLMLEMNTESNGELAEVEQLEVALSRRGWSVTPEVLAFVASSTGQDGVGTSAPQHGAVSGANFCPQCGLKLTAGARFCSNCGNAL